MIRSSKHHFTRFINRGKLADLQELLQEYRRVMQMMKSFRSKKQKKRTVDCSKINMSLSVNNYDIQEKDGHFDEFIRIKSIGNKKFIKIPIKHHKVFNKWNDRGKRISGIEVSDKWVKTNFQVETPTPKTHGRVVGADQGYKTIIKWQEIFV